MYRLIWVVLALWLPVQASAHALQPGYLDLQAMGGEGFRVIWTRPDVRGRPMDIDAVLSEGCSVTSGPAPRFDGRGWVTQWLTDCADGLGGVDIRIDGLEDTRTDVLVRYELEPGRGQTERLTPDRTAFRVPEDPGTLRVFVSYFGLGMEHIAFGLDHLLFVFALLLLIRDLRTLIGAVTAFTVAHSATLAAAALGWTNIPGPPVEAIIALSIMFLASELLHRDPAAPRLSERAPWAVSFAFGLIHGLGFGGALSEIGLPDNEIVVALLAFNLGVEAGQILFILLALTAWFVLVRMLPVLRDGATALRRGGDTAVAYGIGGIAAFWFVERLAGF